MEQLFTVVVLENVPAEQEDILTEFLFSEGASGMAEKLAFRQTNEKYEPETLEAPFKAIEVYFETPPAPDFFERLLLRFPEVGYHESQQEHRDWLSEWKKGFKPFSITDEFWIVPSWEPVPDGVKSYLRIDPGMAFGTGTHETTKLAASLLAHEGVSGSLLDVGTGTGILAMLARQMGAGRVVGIEIDADARVVARENVELNNHSDIEIPDLQLAEITESFDWVVANIIDGVLLELEPDLVRVTKPGGRLLLTGILEEREESFLKRWSSPLKILRRSQLGEWVGFLMEKPR